MPAHAHSVGEVMERVAPVVSAEASLAEVLDVILSTRLNRAIVVDEQRRPVGVISDAELIRRASPRERPGLMRLLMSRIAPGTLSQQEREDLPFQTGKQARDLMRAPVVTVRTDTTFAEATALMLRDQRKVLPVVDADGRLVGIIDRAHLLRAAASQ